MLKTGPLGSVLTIPGIWGEAVQMLKIRPLRPILIISGEGGPDPQNGASEVVSVLFTAAARTPRMPPMVGVLNTPTPNPDDHREGKALYVNEPGFYHLVPGSKKPECKAFRRRVAHEVQQGRPRAHDPTL